MSENRCQFFLKQVFFSVDEDDLAYPLAQVQEEFVGRVQIGSYPHDGSRSLYKHFVNTSVFITITVLLFVYMPYSPSLVQFFQHKAMRIKYWNLHFCRKNCIPTKETSIFYLNILLLWTIFGWILTQCWVLNLCCFLCAYSSLAEQASLVLP